MKSVIVCLTLVWLGTTEICYCADPPTAATTNATPGRGRRGTPNSNDVFYTLGPDSQPRSGVPKGRFTEPKVIPSNVFPGTQHTYWVYVPAQYDPSQPAALMIFNDGQAMMAEPGDVQAHHVLDNLIFRREIPVMLGVFINPGRRPDQPEPNPRDWGDWTSNRPDEYNPATDKYARVVVEELMPALKKEYNVSPDPDLHGIMGASSGGCAAFAAAWFRPNDFRKVITFVGSFTDIRGQYIYLNLSRKVRRSRSGFSCRTAATTTAVRDDPTGTGFFRTCD